MTGAVPRSRDGAAAARQGDPAIVNGSGTIRVVKCNARVEDFDRRKLAAALYRAMAGTEGTYQGACELAWAVEIYLERCNWPCVSSAAIFEMGLKVLCRVGLPEAAEALEDHREDRARRRRWFRVHQDCGKVTVWDKTWVCDLARVGWHVSPATSRILAGEVERRLLYRKAGHATRQEVVDPLNRCVAAFGLADAVPVPQAIV